MLGCLMVYLWRLAGPLRDEKGQDLAEYALLIALIAILGIGAVTLLGNKISSVFDLLC